MNTQQFLDWLAMSQRPSLVMGVLNVTPDSFSDGDLYTSPSLALARVQTMIDQGVDIIDIGGESVRPGSSPVSIEEESNRVIPVIEHIRSYSDICISIDTCKPRVMREAIKAGASWVNDITALTMDGAIQTIAELQVPVCLMHMQGTPTSMQHAPQYGNVTQEISAFFDARIQACLAANISREAIILDPGFGFGKSDQHNLELMRCFRYFEQHNLPLLLGVSRKTTLGNLLNQDIHGRMPGGLALAAYAVMQGASIIRTHDVLETKHVLTILDMLH